MSQVSNVNAKANVRATLESMVADYVANGNAIQHCRMGERGLKPTFWRDLFD